jgi:ribosomal protein S18 acetylase RimI-like enzyme
VDAHLRACDPDFVRALERRVDLTSYAQKLASRAVTLEAWQGERLVGLVAVYLNDPAGRRGYVSSVSVLPGWAGRGIARSLMERCLKEARRLGYEELSLEVDPQNARATRLYAALGFLPCAPRGEMQLQSLRL